MPIHLEQATLGHSSIETTDRYLYANPADIALRTCVRTVFESGINTITKALKYIQSLPYPILDHKPPMLDLVKIWRIRWQIPNLTPGLSNHLLDCLPMMKTGIVNLSR